MAMEVVAIGERLVEVAMERAEELVVVA